MRWYFRDISDDPSEKELTQLDQFNNDEVGLAEALVRETIQNSTDARADTSPAVYVRFSITQPKSEQHKRIFLDIVAGLSLHLKACEFPSPAPNDPFQLLVIEDFGTTGLIGSVEEKDDKQFSGFWRRFGRSNKKGGKGGRWGLGKLVFPSASAVRTVIGLTRRIDDVEREWTMGQSVLRNHSINGSEIDSVGFWCRSGGSKKGLPSDDRELCNELREAAQLVRGKQPGLSLVIPFALPDLTREAILDAAIRNYYFPILTERLTVSVDDTELNSQTFDRVASLLPKGAVSRSTLDFVRHIQNCRSMEPLLVIPQGWQEIDKGITGDLIGAEAATGLRDAFLAGRLIFIRAPLLVQDKDGRQYGTSIDLFFKRTQTGERGQTLVVRGAITVPTEGKRSTFLDCNAALIADDEFISRLLGDAENPAHTQWNERAEKLRAGWQNGWRALRKVRSALQQLHELVTERIERDDPFALLDFFSIPKADRGAGAPHPTGGRPANLPPARQKPFRIERRKGGFVILPAQLTEGAEFPLSFRIRCAYDVLSGNPFKRFNQLDFDLFKAHRGTNPPKGLLSIIEANAGCWATEPNQLDVRAYSAEFSVAVMGFDKNRDVVVEAQS
ncbi:MAG: hypothetical protein WA268_18025 [Xanthobacteraceae bacterium]